jgi:hypothetical protein
MKHNVGGVDRTLRITIGLTMIGLALVGGQIGMWGWLGIIPLLTGIFGYCPPYALFGFNTCSTEKK